MSFNPRDYQLVPEMVGECPVCGSKSIVYATRMPFRFRRCSDTNCQARWKTQEVDCESMAKTLNGILEERKSLLKRIKELELGRRSKVA